MPPVRWKFFVLVTILGLFKTSDAKDFMSMSADGWKPIVGSGGPRPAIISDEITQYRNPIELNEQQLKAQTKPPVIPLKVSVKPGNNSFYIKSKNGVNRIQNLNSGVNHKHVLRINPSINNHNHRQASINKHSVVGIKKAVKPLRSSLQTAYSNKNEVYLPAPSSALGSYVYFNSGRNPVKMRDVPIKHVHTQSAGNPHQYTSFFTLPGLPPPKSTPPQNFIFPNKPNAHDINYYNNQQQDDEYTKNLVPPPPENQVEGEQDLKKINYQQNPVRLPENLVVPPRYESQNTYSQQKFPAHQIQPQQSQQQVEISKENFNVFRNDVPLNYQETSINSYQDPTQYQKFVAKNKEQVYNPNTYEVTEGNYWESPISTTRTPQKDSRFSYKPYISVEDPTIKTFLPTPVKSDPFPTLVSPQDVSTIYSAINVKNKKKNKPSQYTFDIKEVSTHYPILGNPDENSDLANEITTKEELPEKTLVAPTRPTFSEQQDFQSVRPHRRRRPRPKTTVVYADTEIPETTVATIHKRRRINKHKTTAVVTTTETPSPNLSNHKIEEDETEEPMKEVYQKDTYDSISSRLPIEEEFSPYTSTSPPEKDRVRKISKHTKRPLTTTVSQTEVTETAPTERETVSSKLQVYEVEEEDTQETEEPFTTIATTSTTTTTTESTTTSTTKPNRIKQRPLKTKTRPRFSVKDYRQRLGQQSSTSTTSTTESSRTRDPSNRLRFPNRSRRPIGIAREEFVSTSEPTNKFAPKEPRYTTSIADSFTIATEKPVKAVNTRLRPFGRYRSTTTSTTSTTELPQKVQLKPNLFGNNRRPVYPSLKTRIMGKYNRTQAHTTSTERVDDEENNDDGEETPNMITAKMDIREEVDEEGDEEESTTTTDNSEKEDVTTAKTTHDYSVDAEQDESMIQQRISDLTSSADNKYNTPGVYQAVAVTSRNIPNHFTISTEDPVLPIETFFQSFKEGGSKLS